MLLDFNGLLTKYNLQIKGIIHIGAHFGQEYNTYKQNNINNLIFFEPVPHTFKILQNNIGENALLVNKALGNENKKISMNIEYINNGQSSSILEPEIHLIQHPNIIFTDKIEVDMVRLDDYLKEENINVNEYNFINMDVQGYELEVLKGSAEMLNNIDYIMTEVNRDEVYKNCARIEQLDSFLEPYGFIRVETNWAGNTWGDAQYIKYKE